MKMDDFLKGVASLTLVLLFVACGNSQPAPSTQIKTYPAWYTKKMLPLHTKYEVIGYGEGTTLSEAKANAKEDIAQSLISKVDSSFTSSSDDTKSTTKSKLKVTSELNLQNLKTLKQEQSGGVFFIALSYENLDLAYRIKKILNLSTCQDESVNSYISTTLLYKKINSALGCKLDFKLERVNSAWYLKYKENRFLLSDDEFEELFVDKENKQFSFKANKKVLKDGDSFYFTFNSKKSGYITFLDVYENGIVTLLQPSTPISKSLQIPSKNSQNYFEAGLVKKGIDTYDLYVAIFTKKPLDMSRFEYANEDLASSELAHKFDELIENLDNYNYATILLRTKVK